MLGSADPKSGNETRKSFFYDSGSAKSFGIRGSQEIVTFNFFFFCQLKLAKMSISKRLGKLPTYAVY